LQAALASHKCLMTVVAITGERHSRLENLADLTVRAPVTDTAIAQELHMVLMHLLYEITEVQLSAPASKRIAKRLFDSHHLADNKEKGDH
jgi:DNA-binding MurR/RpiR family transcriptional regulator